MPNDQKIHAVNYPTAPIGKHEPAKLPRLGYSIRETWGLLPIGRTTLYDMIKSGQIESVKINRRTMIPAEAIQQYVASLPDVSPTISSRNG